MHLARCVYSLHGDDKDSAWMRWNVTTIACIRCVGVSAELLRLDVTGSSCRPLSTSEVWSFDDVLCLHLYVLRPTTMHRSKQSWKQGAMTDHRNMLQRRLCYVFISWKWLQQQLRHAFVEWNVLRALPLVQRSLHIRGCYRSKESYNCWWN